MGTDADPREVEFQAQFEALRRHFLQGLPERRAALVDAWRACADAGGEPAWQRLREIAHKLSGSAPCYGLEAIGESARALDGLLAAKPRCRERIAAVVAELAVALEAAIGSA